jgi:hypothetical protein
MGCIYLATGLGIAVSKRLDVAAYPIILKPCPAVACVCDRLMREKRRDNGVHYAVGD